MGVGIVVSVTTGIRSVRIVFVIVVAGIWNFYFEVTIMRFKELCVVCFISTTIIISSESYW